MRRRARVAFATGAQKASGDTLRARVPKILAREFCLDVFEAEKDALYCFSTKDDGESASTYDQVLQSSTKASGCVG